MLILTRRIGETLMIGDDVSISVLNVQGNQVRIGINAPKEISVHREEIYRRIQEEKQGGSPLTPPSTPNKRSSQQPEQHHSHSRANERHHHEQQPMQGASFYSTEGARGNMPNKTKTPNVIVKKKKIRQLEVI